MRRISLLTTALLSLAGVAHAQFSGGGGGGTSGLPTSTTVAGLSLSTNPTAAALAGALPAASTSTPGLVKADGTTTTVTNGVISVPSSAFDAPGAAAAIGAHTVAGVAISSNPTAAALAPSVAAAIPTVSTSGPGLAPAVPSGSNLVLGASGWQTATGGGNVSTDTAGTISAQTATAPTAQTPRSLAARAADTFNCRDYGCDPTGGNTAIGTTYGTSVAALAAYTAPNGSHPFAQATNQLFGLTFPMTTSAAQSAAGTGLTFVDGIGGNIWGYSANVALWTDPQNRYMLPSPGMLVTSSNGCIPAGDTIAAGSSGSIPGMTTAPYTAGSFPDTWGISSVPVRQDDLYPAMPLSAWASGTFYSTGSYVTSSNNVYQAMNSATAGGTAPTGTGQPGDGGVGWQYIAASNTWPAAGYAAETDWAPNTAYAVNARVQNAAGHWVATVAGTSAAGRTVTTPVLPNGFTYGGPTYASSYGGVFQGTASGFVGSTVTDGGVTWKLVAAAEYRMLPTGVINLATATTSACPTGTVFTFTLAPAQLEALDTSYLGIQAAVMNAWAYVQAGNNGPNGARVELPQGMYRVNHQILNPFYIISTNVGAWNLDFYGAGHDTTMIQLTANYNGSASVTQDLGADSAVLLESNSGNQHYSSTKYHDFSIRSDYNNALIAQNGLSPQFTNGLSCGSQCHVDSVDVSQMHGGIRISEDHQSFFNIGLSNNGCGILYSDYGRAMGNQMFELGGIGGGSVAGICIPTTNQMDSSNINAGIHSGFGPYQAYSLPNLPSVTNGSGTMISGSTLIDPWCEAAGEECVHTSLAFNGNRVIGGGTPNAGSYGCTQGGQFQLPTGLGGCVPAQAVFQVGSFTGNTLMGTDLGASFQRVSRALINTAGSCDGNQFINDPQMIVGVAGGNVVPTQNVPALRCGTTGGYGLESRWDYPGASGDFHVANLAFGTQGTNQGAAAGVGTFRGEPMVADVNGGDFVDASYDGAATYGFAAASCAADGQTRCPIQTAGVINNVPNLSGAQINPGQPVFASNIGVSFGVWSGITGGVTTSGMDGSNIGACGAGGRCTIRIGGGGSPGADMGLTGGAAISHSLATFSTVASGASSALPQEIALGQCIRIINNGANALTLTAPTGWTTATTSVPAAGSVIVSRNGLASYN